MMNILKKTGMLVIAFLSGLTGNTIAQDWNVQGMNLLHQGKPAFLAGANYIPSQHWLTILRNWDGAVVEQDMQAMQSMGIRYIRFFPLWSLIHKEPGKLDNAVLENLDKLVEIAGRHGIQLQITPLTGFVSGGMFFPKWATGNIFKDEELIQAQEFYMEAMARRYGNNPAVQAFDLGNESNVMIHGNRFEVTPAEVAHWMGRLSAAFRRGAPGALFTVSTGTGFDEYYTNETLAKNSDFLVVHPWIYWHGTLKLDPWIGQRTLYDSNYMIEWAAMMGKPVVVQENGASEEWLPVWDIPSFLRVNFLSSWAEGSKGFLWWCSHYIDQDFRIPGDIFLLDRSAPTYEEGRFHALEYSMGLFDTGNNPLPWGLEFKRNAEMVERLGQGWTDLLPVCYILVPEKHDDFAETMLHLITPFALAKQAHFDVKMLYENVPVPEDAAVVVIAGFGLSEAGKQNVKQYLARGGTVYQSGIQDFARDLIRSGPDRQTMENPQFLVRKRAGGMTLEGKVAVHSKIDIQPLTTIPAEQGLLAEPLVFTRAPEGRGTYYYFSGNLEESLRNSYNPWDSDHSNLIYSAFRPVNAIDVSSKYVELFHKRKGDTEILVLINHSNTKQETEVFSAGYIALKDYFTGLQAGEGFRIPVSVDPLQVLVFELKKNNS
jgi:hypothetical protein